MISGIRAAVRQFEPDQPIVDPRTMEQVISESVAQPRAYALLLGVFAVLAVVLAAAGVYGVMSYTVSQQRHEIGIRMALGAQNRRIAREIASRALGYVLIGIGFGLAAALAATRLLSTMLFEVKQTDPSTYASVSLFLLAWTMASIWIPARRASLVDPLVALRHE
jgi:putative ABC transport system permease protein